MMRGRGFFGRLPIALLVSGLLGLAPAAARKPPPKAKPKPAATEPAERVVAPARDSPPKRVAEEPVAPAAGGREVVQRESRIEFDERLVQGQTAAGAIYLFQRGESEFRSMVKLPESFRERTVRGLLREVKR